MTFWRAMNCRSFSTTPPSPSSLCRSRLLVSLHPRVSLRTYIRRGGGAGKVSLPLHSKLPCCSLHERHNHSVCPPPPKQNIYYRLAPMFIYVCYVYMHTLHTYMVLAGTEPYMLPEISVGRLPLPPDTEYV